MRITEEAARRIAARCTYLASKGRMLVMDGDVHPTPMAALPDDVADRVRRDPNYYHGRPLVAEDLIAALDRAGIDMAMCWQNPAVLAYIDDEQENYRRLRAANAAIAYLAVEHPTRVMPAGWTDPKALGLELAQRLAQECVAEFAMPVVKMNPAQNSYPIDDPMVLAVVDTIVEMGAVPAFHFGADTLYTPASGLETVALRHPHHPVIGVHMGGGGGHFVEAEETYQAARELGLRRPNVFYVLSAIRDPHIESALLSYAAAGDPFRRNIAVGSDAPYGNMIWNFGGFRALFAAMKPGNYGDPRLAANPDLLNEETTAGFMGGNLAALIVAADKRIIARDAALARVDT